MEEGPGGHVTSDPPDLGKGLFGYRKSAVNQILADRDVMLRQAEGRVRAAESKVADLQNELTSMKDRNTRMDEQVERLRAQLEVLMANAQAAPAAMPSAPSQAPAVAPPAEEPRAASEPDPVTPWEDEPAPWEDDFGQPSVAGLSPFGEEGSAVSYDEYGESVASFEGLDQAPATPGGETHDDMPLVFETGEEQHADVPDSAHLFGEAFGEAAYEGDSVTDFAYETSTPDADHDLASWEGPMPPPAAEPMRKVDEMRYQPDDSPESPSAPAGEDDGLSSVPYGFSLQSAQPDEGATNHDYGDQPVFRGFTDDSFDDPNPSEYIGQPAAPITPSPSSTTQAPEWPADPSLAWTQPSEPTPEWPETQAAAESSLEWEPTSAQPTPDWTSEPSPVQPLAAAESPQAAESEPRGGASSQSSTDITNRFLTEELKGILSAAEESAARILERARATSEHQIAQSNRLWREVQAELARFAAWREQVEPIIRSVHAKVEGVRGQIEEVPEKIRQALAPMADSISMIDSDLAELASASTPPLLLTPSGLDPGSPVNDWPIGEGGSPSTESPQGHTEPGGGTGHLAS
jgi:predicted  nucleic acid-binding Zn-ribbon protein